MKISEIRLDHHAADARAIDRLLDPRSIAIIGASADPKRLGGIALDHLVEFDYRGAIYPINPKYPQMHGIPCYPDIESLPETPDLAVLAISADQVLPTLERCHEKGVKAAVVYAAGFSEEGEAGQQRQDALEAFARETKMAICGPNCMGLVNLNTRAITAFATMLKHYPPRVAGNVGLVTQSGNMSIVIYSLGCEVGIRFSQFINTGNEACLEFSEYLEYLVDDPQTEIVIGYIEGLRDGARFIRAARKLQEANKPLILIKSGETEQGSVAAMSHTASLAGNRAINRAAFRQLGVLQARDPSHLIDLTLLATYAKGRTAGPRIAVTSISGVMGGLITDLLVSGGLDVPAFPLPLQEHLRTTAPELGMVANPVDLTGNLYNREGLAAKVFDALAGDESIDTVLVYATGYLLDRISDELIHASKSSGRLFVVIDSGKAESREKLVQAGLPVFTDVARAVNALVSYLPWVRNRKLDGAASLEPVDATVRSPLPPAKVSRLDEHQAKVLLADYGVPIGPEVTASDADTAALEASRVGFPVVLKILSPDIAHKTEVGGVRLKLESAEAVRQAHIEVIQNASRHCPDAELRGTLVQRMEKGVAELIVGVTRDPVFGLAMTVGLGGVLTEILQDASHRLLPVTEEMAGEMLKELKGYRLLTGYRNVPKADIDAACKAIAAVSRAAMAMPDSVTELEINPLLVKAESQGAIALDALILTE